ncbi:MAG: molybdenum cofactor biosynthesis protein MoaE [Gammaproteobacteria bacterium]|nr:molybdenum cofactor biosynthesis protein MoaE [Gammaproteobacteria bacterium]MDH5613442.1 molybdenum cofactor biosynthesis protein MoaE [Gammaproteobacteria bacterium]
MDKRVIVTDTIFDPLQEVQRFQNAMQAKGQFGACVTFVGTMRDFNENTDVQKMTLEHYPGMTEKHLSQIIDEAKNKWDILDAFIVHRVGDFKPGDPIVLVATWSAHRAEAYEANRYLIEELKSRAPFWKKETLKEGTRWVEHNTLA